MAHSVKLHYGADKRNPTRSLDLVGTGTTDNIYLRQTGHTVAAGQQQILWNDGGGYRHHGARRENSKRKNSELSLSFDLVGDSAATIEAFRQSISRFLEEARLYEEERTGAPVWLEYRWHDSLNDIAQPVFGQLSKFVRILSGDIERWPDQVHSGAIITGNVPNVVVTLTGKPLWEGLEQVAGDCDDFPDSGADPDLFWTLSDSEITAQWAVAGWITHTEADYVVFEYYEDSNNYVRVEWDESDGRFEVVRNVSGSPTTYNGTSQSLSEGDEVHIALVQNGSNQLLFVNGSQDDSDTTNTWGSGGIFSLGWATSIGTTANCAGLDGWRVWNDDLTATQIGYIYANEQPVKAAGLTIGRPPYCLTKAGDGTIHAVDGTVSSTDKQNYAVVGWAPGDVEARVKWSFDPPTGGTLVRGFFLNRNAVDDTFTPLASTFLDFSGTAAVGTASGDAYEASGTLNYHIFDATISNKPAVRGDLVFVGRAANAGDNNAKARPYIQFGSSQFIQPNQHATIIRNVTQKLLNFGSLRIDWPMDETPPVIKGGLTVQATSTNTLLNDLVAYWPLLESAGPRYDLAGGHHLTENGSVGSAAGRYINNASDFDGSSYLWTPGPDLSRNGDFSVSFWVYLDVTTTQFVLDKSYSSPQEYYIFYNTSTSKFTMTIYGGTNVAWSSTSTTGTWYHIYAYFDHGTGIGISINNGSAATAAYAGDIVVGNNPFNLGRTLNGRLTHVGFWKRLLTSDERTELYQGATGSSPMWYPFEETSINLDFVNILKRPVAEIVGTWPTLASGDTVVVDGRRAWVRDASGSDSQLLHLNYAGDEVTVLPQKYNYVTLLLGAANDAYAVSSSVTNFKAYITPRWTLPGGAVA